ncbi:MAG: helix-turn-helix domain-containing protein [Bacillota bacterium]
MADDFVSRVPWSLEPSLKEKATDVGVDFDRFIEGLAAKRSDSEMAAEFGVSDKVISHLRHHFETVGLQSIQGQD